MTEKSKCIERKIGKWGATKTKNICSAKGPVRKMKRKSPGKDLQITELTRTGV